MPTLARAAIFFASGVFIALLMLSGLAAAPSIRAADGRLQAQVMPAEGWCSPVVNVDLRATPHVFTSAPEEVQRFIGAVRASVTFDCPSVEIIRIRGFERRDAKFFGYTTKEDNWRIRVLPFSDHVLPMLAFEKAQSALSRELAYFETRRLFDRAKLPDADFDRSNAAEDADHLNWSIDDVRGATYVLTDRRRKFRSLAEFADLAAHVFVKQCAEGEGGIVAGANATNAASNAQVRTFDCSKNGLATKYGVVSSEDHDLTVVLVFESEYHSLFKTFLEFLTAKHNRY